MHALRRALEPLFFVAGTCAFWARFLAFALPCSRMHVNCQITTGQIVPQIRLRVLSPETIPVEKLRAQCLLHTDAIILLTSLENVIRWPRRAITSQHPCCYRSQHCIRATEIGNTMRLRTCLLFEKL